MTEYEESDETLMQRVQARDEEAYTRLLDRHLQAIHAYVYRMCQNRADADDLAQETFLRIWHKAATWKPGTVRFTTWLHRIAHNQCIDAFRRRRIDVDPDTQLDELPSQTSGADIEVETRRKAVRSAVAALPERQRTALALCHFQGWSNKDAAEVLEVSVDALESLLARARRTLKTELIEYREEVAT